MDYTELKKLLEQFQNNKIDAETVASYIQKEESEVCIDNYRKERCGFPEFIYGAEKSVEQIKTAIKKLKESKESSILATRISNEKYNLLKNLFPEAEYDAKSGSLIIKKDDSTETKGKIALITAGSSDIPVAMEAKYTAELCNCNVESFFDIGVAGIHRLFSKIESIKSADVVICVAGMEGALPSVVAGLVRSPLIAVPTSVGYGASMKGLTAMFSMLNSCANGVTVVNIDNGFGAGCAAARIINSFPKNK